MVSLYAARAATHSIWQKTHDFLALKRLYVYIFREGPESDGLQLPRDEPGVRCAPEAREERLRNLEAARAVDLMVYDEEEDAEEGWRGGVRRRKMWRKIWE
jgi:hypothetical protein